MNCDYKTDADFRDFQRIFKLLKLKSCNNLSNYTKGFLLVKEAFCTLWVYS